MFQEYFARSSLLSWPVVGLVLIFLAFIGVLVYVFFGMRDRRRIVRLAALPLEGDESVEIVDREERTE